MPIIYVKGDATNPQTNNQPVILMHIVNNKRGWGKGFVVALSKKWKLPEQKYRQWEQETFELGNVQFVKVNNNITVANMLAQDGYGGVAVKYDHLRTCLKKVCEYAQNIKAVVAAPKIGAGLGGGSWVTIEKIIEQELCDKGIEVKIYLLDN